jgi:hypothetical protein
VVTHQAGLIYGKFDYAFGTRRKRRLAKRRAFATSNRTLNRTDDLARLYAQFPQNLYCNAIFFPNQPK